jgi:hypothetical protein
MSGTFNVTRSSIGQVIDTNCQIRSMTFVSGVSVVEPVSYSPTWPNLPSAGTFCLADQDNYLNFTYNFDVQNNASWVPNVAVPITPATPPSPKIISKLTCLSCPQGVSITVVTG